MTKLRVAFDASVVGATVHNFHEVRPQIEPDLLKYLLKFRSYPVTLTGGIANVYEQILINPKNVDFQRIFWRFRPRESISSYILFTVTYGTVCAPFLAITTLYHLTKYYSSEFPHAAGVILESFYVEDILCGWTKQMVSDLYHVLTKAGFTLKK